VFHWRKDYSNPETAGSSEKFGMTF